MDHEDGFVFGTIVLLMHKLDNTTTSNSYTRCDSCLLFYHLLSLRTKIQAAARSALASDFGIAMVPFVPATFEKNLTTGSSRGYQE